MERHARERVVGVLPSVVASAQDHVAQANEAGGAQKEAKAPRSLDRPGEAGIGHQENSGDEEHQEANELVDPVISGREGAESGVGEGEGEGEEQDTARPVTPPAQPANPPPSGLRFQVKEERKTEQRIKEEETQEPHVARPEVEEVRARPELEGPEERG